MKRTPQSTNIARYFLTNPEPTYARYLADTLDYGPGTVHAILRRMLNAGWITAEWEQVERMPERPLRRYYQVAGDDGRRQLEHFTQTRRQRP